jgi:hypothetical protein
MANFLGGLTGAATGFASGGPIGAVVGGLGGLFGGGKKKSAGSTGLNSFNAPGLFSFSNSNGTGQFNSAIAPNYLGSLGNVNAETTAGYDSMSRFIRPGSGTLSNALADVYNAQRNRLGNSRSEAISNLRDSLSRRRLGGSSFASDSLARADAEYRTQENELAAQQAADQAKVALQEYELTRQNFEARQQARNNYILDSVKMLQVDAQTAAQIVSGINQSMSQSTALNAELMKQAAEASGGNFGSSLGSLGGLKDAFSSLSGLFGPSGTAGGVTPGGNQTYWGEPTPIKP